MIIVIDGPAGAGKSSTAKAVAAKLNIQYLDSGALYRALTYHFLTFDNDMDSFLASLPKLLVRFEDAGDAFRVWIDDEEVTSFIRTDAVSSRVSEVASNSKVRSFVNDLMRAAVQDGQYIAEGRDLGSVVFPNAACKIFLSASIDERARRRYSELPKDEAITLADVRNNIARRDEKDRNREVAPLSKADDAQTVDSTDMNFEEQLTHICRIITDETSLKSTY